MDPLVLGLDVGGTASRAVAATVDGRVEGRGRAGGGNPITVGLERAVEQVAEAAAAALAGVDPARVRAGVMGIAGTSVFGGTETRAAFRRAWEGLGLRCEVRPVGDVVVAYAAGAAEPRGTVLIAGTGAVAARIDGEREVRVHDGLGWLLGDLGSGFWIGREAAALTAEALRAGSPTPLARAVAEAVAGSEAVTSDAFTGAVYREAPSRLAALAPLVERCAREGDRAAGAVLDRAAEHLSRSALAVAPHGEAGPIVLAGSVLRECDPVRSGVRSRLAEALPGTEIRVAAPGELGAARLAARGIRP